MSKDIIINHLPHEIRVAILEDQRLSEIYHERICEDNVVGNIYKGKVLSILPGLASAFVDIGTSRAAFLHAGDVAENIPDMIDDAAGTDTEESAAALAEESAPEAAQRPSKNALDIRQLLSVGQEVLVQVIKAPINTKGARLTCNISLAGRNLVFVPQTHSVSISKRIRKIQERKRLKELVDKYNPQKFGFIVRTVAEAQPEEEFAADIDYLTAHWEKTLKAFADTRSPALLTRESNLTYRTLRDMLSAQVSAVYIDNAEEHASALLYLNKYLPHFSGKLKLFQEAINIFDHFNVSSELEKAMENVIYLESGGHLVIDQSEALTSIDVNTGRFTGKDSHEETVYKTNVEAIYEIAKQLKLRNIGGIIVIDFIDMHVAEHRESTYKILKQELRKDRTRHKILAVSELGLVEMTRQRSRENLRQYLSMSCPHCQGSGRVKSLVTTAYDIFRDINRVYQKLQSKPHLLTLAHPDVIEYIESEEQLAVQALEQKYETRLFFKKHNDPSIAHEQFELLRLNEASKQEKRAKKSVGDRILSVERGEKRSARGKNSATPSRSPREVRTPKSKTA